LDGSTLALRSDLLTPLTDFVLAPDGTRLAVGLTGGVVAIYNPVDLSEIASFATAIAEPHLQLLPQVDAGGSGQVIVSGDGRAERWQYGDGEGLLLATYEPSDPLYSVEGAALSLDGSLLTVAGNYVIFFDAASGERLVTWGPTDGAEGVAVRAIDERGVLRLRAVLEGNG
jgi:hypothetical protein